MERKAGHIRATVCDDRLSQARIVQLPNEHCGKRLAVEVSLGIDADGIADNKAFGGSIADTVQVPKAALKQKDKGGYRGILRRLLNGRHTSEDALVAHTTS